MTSFKEFMFLLIGLINIALISKTQASFPYYGTKIGSLKRLHHGVGGDVYAVDSRTIFLKNFNYDGEAPAAYFYVGNSKKPTNEGAFRLRDERGGTSSLIRRYRNKDITLSLPEGKTLRDIKWFSVWCDEFSVNFGDVSIPPNLDFPRPQKISSLGGVHGVRSDNIVIVDAQTLLIPNFSYDGEAPDAKFWVGRGPKPSPQGLRIPDENGKENPLRRYDRKTIVLTLPADLTIFDIGHFGVWCEAFTVDFGHVRIPDGLNVPPSLKMLGISPQSKLNCEVLYDDLAFEVRWAVAGESIVVQLVAKLEDGEYMSFGISSNNDRPEMIGSDVVVAWVDKETGKGYAQDYYLDDKSQCSGKRGSCPDVNIEDNTNSIRLLNAAMVNGYSIVTYQRSLGAADRYDLPIVMNTSQAIVWAIGPLNQRNEVSYHSKYTKNVHLVNFGRQPTWNCPMPEGEKPGDEQDVDDDEEDAVEKQKQQQEAAAEEEQEEEFYDSRTQKPTPQALLRPTRRQQEVASSSSSRKPSPVPTPKPANTNGAWDIPPIQCYEPEDGVFYAQMGPTGGKHGYPAITGHVGWGISWYINGLLIPEIHLVRGKSYTFVVEGGNNPDIPAKYHPFYITDDPIGGYEYKTDEEKAAVKVFAGVHRSRSGKVTPTGVGRLCNWTPDIDGPPADDFQSFGAYQRTLTLECDDGEPGVITWTPDRNTPDTVYYHCYTHRHLGWRIHIHDSCDEAVAASELDETIARRPAEEDYAAESSIRHETKVSPNDNFLLKHQTDLIKNHNMNGTPPKLSFELSKSTEITKLISDGIRAAEALEESIKIRKNPISSMSSTAGQIFPPIFPQLSTSTPEILSGETMKNLSHHLAQPTNTMIHSSMPQDPITSQSSGPMTFLRPPQTNIPYRPIKRRPYPMKKERLPVKRPHPPPPSLLASMMPAPRPVAIPQPSMIINHYRKPIPSMMKPFIKDKPYPVKSMPSVLLLGQPTELDYKRQTEPLLKGTKPKPSGIIPVPYGDAVPQEAIQNFVFAFNGNGLSPKEKKPLIPEKVPTLVYKTPYEVRESQEDIDLTALKPAVNQGFKPDTVVVEGGFKPINRKKTTDEDETNRNEPKISRRKDDPGSEIDEVMETDTLFLSQDNSQNQNFEPMFIPSPPDSTNDTIIYNKSTAAKLTAAKLTAASKLTDDLSDMEVEDGDDKMAVAAERVDTYYLPPEKKPTTSQRPLPTGAVVTYDGKAVLDTTLVNPPKLEARDTLKSTHGLSKSESLVRNTPQFGPFRGEMPPSIPEFLATGNGSSLTKPITEYTNPLTLDGITTPKVTSSSISTKLSLLKSPLTSS
ncbi:protein Skeletor, isoforms B/C isoform X2 [Episyrphus balteatus]|uniref:protein Skeletor, isoforms B/C isoform X2 n=1 Tax=Episyrphus balteatus TaxID=286459 RepID=UPI0024867C6D|nr:protein Skeletor, isoforms B/C isoform X2 [Episyrphus balteatus]